ncbi:MAG: hypothetical protein WDW38_003020 [Sanguina aurantia]
MPLTAAYKPPPMPTQLLSINAINGDSTHRPREGSAKHWQDQTNRRDQSKGSTGYPSPSDAVYHDAEDDTTFTRASPDTAGTPAAGNSGGKQTTITSHFFKASSFPAGGALALRPSSGPGMVNHGNTCYLNSVLQVLFNLAPFVADLMSPRLSEVGVPRDGVVAAMQRCLSDLQRARRRGVRSISPSALKQTLGKRTARWRGFNQQDAHEFLVNLLELVQGEVLEAEAATHHPAGRRPIRRLPLSTTACPASRAFTGCLLRTYTCTQCRHCSEVREQSTHLSLQLPPTPDALLAGGKPTLQSLLAAHFKEEDFEKSCEGCGAAKAVHSVAFQVRRLPRVLVVHLKRFDVARTDAGRLKYTKLHVALNIGATVTMEPFCQLEAMAHPLLLETLPTLTGLGTQDDSDAHDSPTHTSPPPSRPPSPAHIEENNLVSSNSFYSPDGNTMDTTSNAGPAVVGSHSGGGGRHCGSSNGLHVIKADSPSPASPLAADVVLDCDEDDPVVGYALAPLSWNPNKKIALSTTVHHPAGPGLGPVGAPLDPTHPSHGSPSHGGSVTCTVNVQGTPSAGVGQSAAAAAATPPPTRAQQHQQQHQQLQRQQQQPASAPAGLSRQRQSLDGSHDLGAAHLASSLFPHAVQTHPHPRTEPRSSRGHGGAVGSLSEGSNPLGPVDFATMTEDETREEAFQRERMLRGAKLRGGAPGSGSDPNVDLVGLDAGATGAVTQGGDKSDPGPAAAGAGRQAAGSGAAVSGVSNASGRSPGSGGYSRPSRPSGGGGGGNAAAQNGQGKRPPVAQSRHGQGPSPNANANANANAISASLPHGDGGEGEGQGKRMRTAGSPPTFQHQRSNDGRGASVSSPVKILEDPLLTEDEQMALAMKASEESYARETGGKLCLELHPQQQQHGSRLHANGHSSGDPSPSPERGATYVPIQAAKRGQQQLQQRGSGGGGMGHSTQQDFPMELQAQHSGFVFSSSSPAVVSTDVDSEAAPFVDTEAEAGTGGNITDSQKVIRRNAKQLQSQQQQNHQAMNGLDHLYKASNHPSNFPSTSYPPPTALYPFTHNQQEQQQQQQQQRPLTTNHSRGRDDHQARDTDDNTACGPEVSFSPRGNSHHRPAGTVLPPTPIPTNTTTQTTHSAPQFHCLSRVKPCSKPPEGSYSALL